MTREERYLDINEFRNAADYLEKAALFLSLVNDPFRWKWAAICLTDALYGFMISALVGSNYHRVVDWSRWSTKERRARDALDRQGTPKAYVLARQMEEKFLQSNKAKLIPFKKALEMVQDKNAMKLYSLSDPISIGKEELDRVVNLREVFRNEFIHFMPKHWSIEEGYLMPHFEDTISIIQKLLNNFNITIRHREQVEHARQVANSISAMISANRAALGFESK